MYVDVPHLDCLLVAAPINTTGISILSPELDGKRQESSKSHARYRKA
jgi:hypothetical protein